MCLRALSFPARLQLLLLVILTAAAGCTRQLTQNTVNTSQVVTDVYSQQVLENVSKSIENPWAIPSQSEVTTGTVQTNATINPSVSFPIFKSFATNADGITKTQSATSGSLGGSATLLQNWNLLAVTDAAYLRRVRSIYRFAIFGYEDPGDVRFLDLVYPNRQSGWIYWRTTSKDGAASRLPPEGVSAVSMGTYGNHEILITKDASQSGLWQELVLAVMASNDEAVLEAMAPPGTTKGRASSVNILSVPGPLAVPD